MCKLHVVYTFSTVFCNSALLNEMQRQHIVFECISANKDKINFIGPTLREMYMLQQLEREEQVEKQILKEKILIE